MKENETDWMGEPIFSNEEFMKLVKLVAEASATPEQFTLFLRRCETARAQERVLGKVLGGQLKIEGWNEKGEAVLVPVD